MGLKCTMPKCRVEIQAWTGLQEIEKLQKHFAKKHKVELSMEAALKVREAMETGEVPIRIEHGGAPE